MALIELTHERDGVTYTVYFGTFADDIEVVVKSGLGRACDGPGHYSYYTEVTVPGLGDLMMGLDTETDEPVGLMLEHASLHKESPGELLELLLDATHELFHPAISQGA